LALCLFLFIISQRSDEQSDVIKIEIDFNVIKMTTEESKQTILDKFRDLFSSLPPDASGMPLDDQTFSRYLRARKYNIDQAKKLLEATIEWRKEYGLDEMLTTWRPTIESENASGKLYARGYDKVTVVGLFVA
jgi:hypothetical protein